jgi:hypothetical protein
MNEAVFKNEDETGDIVCIFWSDVTLDEMQLVFPERMNRLKWVGDHDGEYVPE